MGAPILEMNIGQSAIHTKAVAGNLLRYRLIRYGLAPSGANITLRGSHYF
ncbi:hypothetical protein AXFE_01630 [Acidithrix ferrooxidans]|uniref:Uncharacterized protein n=1 Tax=Acidithrix ferrooxidans TaxID=1280514 RepID=A0A0D8HM87_9ACTN|nr:hypothetical protein AXFE_01630 [Acidithrix ferrooxidans]